MKNVKNNLSFQNELLAFLELCVYFRKNVSTHNFSDFTAAAVLFLFDRQVKNCAELCEKSYFFLQNWLAFRLINFPIKNNYPTA